MFSKNRNWHAKESIKWRAGTAKGSWTFRNKAIGKNVINTDWHLQKWLTPKVQRSGNSCGTRWTLAGALGLAGGTENLVSRQLLNWPAIKAHEKREILRLINQGQHRGYRSWWNRNLSQESKEWTVHTCAISNVSPSLVQPRIQVQKPHSHKWQR